MFLNDFQNNTILGVGQPPGTALSGTTANNGTGRDMGEGVGQTHAVCMTGAATGSPSSYTVIFKLQECATSGGTYTDISGATVTATGDNQTKHIRTNKRTLPYVRVVATPAFSGGSSPTAPVASMVFTQDSRI